MGIFSQLMLKGNVVKDAINNGSAMVSMYDLSYVVTALLNKGADFKVEALNNGIYMVSVLRIKEQQKTA